MATPRASRPGQTYDMSYSCTDGSGVTHTGSNSIAAGERLDDGEGDPARQRVHRHRG